MTARDHVIVINRWRAAYAHYADYLDHTTTTVSYVTTAVGRDGVPADASDIRIVGATDDYDSVRAAALELAALHGNPRCIVALKEDDLLVAAQLNQEFGLPGRTPTDLAVFRDKLAMARRVASAGLALPTFAEIGSVSQLTAFGAEHGWPVVVKPRWGSSSAGVAVVPDATAAQSLSSRLAAEPSWLVQSFDHGMLCHVDGLFDGRELGPWRISRYLGTPLKFREGGWVGSVEDDRPEVIDAAGDFTRDVLRSLTSHATAFHLELFLHLVDGHASCVFLEVGARVGGAETPFLWRDVHGFDLMAAAFDLALGRRLSLDSVDLGSEVAGLMLMSCPTARPCRVRSVTSALGTSDALYAEETAQLGAVIPDADAYYEHVGGRFRFRGPDTETVEAAIADAAAAFAVDAEPLAVVQA